MPKFKSRPLFIEAVQWTGSNQPAIEEFTEGAHNVFIQFGKTSDFSLWVDKSKAWCDLKIGDWIMREPDGSGFYPCANHIFQQCWEKVADNETGKDEKTITIPATTGFWVYCTPEGAWKANFDPEVTFIVKRAPSPADIFPACSTLLEEHRIVLLTSLLGGHTHEASKTGGTWTESTGPDSPAPSDETGLLQQTVEG